MYPHPCGFYGDSAHACKCSMGEISRYRQRLSGPLLDRIDMTLEVARLPVEKLVREEQPRPVGTGVSLSDVGTPVRASAGEAEATVSLTADPTADDLTVVPTEVDGRETSAAIKRRVSAAG